MLVPQEVIKLLRDLRIEQEAYELAFPKPADALTPQAELQARSSHMRLIEQLALKVAAMMLEVHKKEYPYVY